MFRIGVAEHAVPEKILEDASTEVAGMIAALKKQGINPEQLETARAHLTETAGRFFAAAAHRSRTPKLTEADVFTPLNSTGIKKLEGTVAATIIMEKFGKLKALARNMRAKRAFRVRL